MNTNETAVTQAVNLQRIFNDQRSAQLKDPYPSLALRKDRINRMIDMVVRHEQPFIDAVMADFENRSPLMTRFSDLMPTLENLKYVRKHLKQWMKPEKRKSRFPLGLMGAQSKVEHIPLGVVGNISPWNFPIQLALSPMADIFGAGNRIMLKPSELSPQISEVMADAINSCFDESELAVVLGGPDVSAEFSKLKFDHLLFTGSTNIARLVSQAAAPNLVPMTLELGGKNPVIISSSADIKSAADKIMWAKTLNGGQICLCPDTIFIPDHLIEEFINACKTSVKAMFPDAATDTEYTHIITQRHADRLRDIEAEAKSSGARVIPLSESSSDKRRVLPTMILNAEANSRLVEEEIFGGLLSVMSYSNLQEAVNYINDRPKPLALYYFGKNKQEIEKLTYETSSGGMVVNDMLAHILQEDLPFGGVGDSGTGCYHGYDGFKNFSHAKAVFKQSNLDPFKMLRPPYGKLINKMIASQIKR
jgi:coniferyl-aldehyde dehydrogenase